MKSNIYSFSSKPFFFILIGLFILSSVILNAQAITQNINTNKINITKNDILLDDFSPLQINTTIYTWYWTANPPLCQGFYQEDQRFRAISNITVFDLTTNTNYSITRHFPADPPDWEAYYMCSYGTHIYLPQYNFTPPNQHDYYLKNELTLWKWTQYGMNFVLVNTDYYRYNQTPNMSSNQCGGGTQCQCGYTLVASHVMNYDLTNCGSNGLIIGANNITLNCNGHTISQNSHCCLYDAIYINNKSDITITNCNLISNANGMEVFYSSNINVLNSNISYNGNMAHGGRGIYSYNSNGIILNNNILDGNYYAGADLQYTPNSILNQNRLRPTSYGFYTYYSNNTIITNNQIFDGAANYGISVTLGDKNFISGNILSNLSCGLYLSSSSYNSVKNNIFSKIGRGSCYGTRLVGTPTRYNNISDNNYTTNFYGLSISNPSTLNNVWNNIFFNNSYNAYEGTSVTGNLWNNSGVGNYWSDFLTNSGYPNNYTIAGPGDGVDYKPNTYVGGPCEFYISSRYDNFTRNADIDVLCWDRLLGRYANSGRGNVTIYYPNGTYIKTSILNYTNDNVWRARINLQNYSLPRGIYSIRAILNNNFGNASLNIGFTSTIIRGFVLDIDGNTVENSLVSLYNSSNINAPLQTVSSSSMIDPGHYEFTPVNPGSYFIIARKEGYIDSFGQTVEIYGNNLFFYYNITLVPENVTLRRLEPQINDLYLKSTNTMIYSTQLMQGVIDKFKSDMSPDPLLWNELVVDWGTFFLGLHPTVRLPPEVARNIQQLGGLPFNEYLECLTKAADVKIEYTLQLLGTYEDVLLTANFDYVKNVILGSETNNLFSAPLYVTVYEKIYTDWYQFRNISNSQVDNDFDYEKAQNMINTQLYQYDRINRGEANILIAPIPTAPFYQFETKKISDAYMAKSKEMEDAGRNGRITSWGNLALTSGALIAGSFGALPIAGVLIGLRLVVDAADYYYTLVQATTSIELVQFVNIYSVRSWQSDIIGIPVQYKLLQDFLLNESQNPHYLNKNMNFRTQSTFVDKACDLEVNNICYYYITNQDKIKQISINVKNYGNDSSVRIVPSVRVPLDSPAILTPETITINNLVQNEDRNIIVNVPLQMVVGRNQDLNIHIFSGASYLEVIRLIFQTGISQSKILLLNKNRWETKESTLILTNYSDNKVNTLNITLNVNNTIFEYNYTASPNIHSLRFSLIKYPFAVTDLHIYDSENHHVGYNYENNSISIEFPAHFSNDGLVDEVEIPNSANKTYKIVARLRTFSIYTDAKEFLDIVEIPKKPAMLGYFPIGIDSYGIVGNDIIISSSLRELSEQQSISNVTVFISTIANLQNSQLILQSNLSAEVTLLAGESKNVNFEFSIPEDYPLGNYTGTILISTGEANLTQPVTIQVLGVTNASLHLSIPEIIEYSGSPVRINATVNDKYGNPVEGALVFFMTSNDSVINFSNNQEFTDENGFAFTEITPIAIGHTSIIVADISGAYSESNVTIANMVCHSDVECPEDIYVNDSFCYGEGIYRMFRNFSCQNPGTFESQCVFTDIQILQQDCSVFDLPEIAICSNNPDNNPFTWDYATGFFSTCDAQTLNCTLGYYSFEHTCSIQNCSAECETNADCDDGIPETEDVCGSDCICSNSNAPPVIEQIPDITINENETVIITVIAQDPNGDDLTYYINDTRFNQNSNIFTWQTGFDDSGNYSVKINVTDGELWDEQIVGITVTDVQTCYPYVPGDANGNGQANGIDVTYLVRYFKAIGPPPPYAVQTPNGTFYPAADANGNCQNNGIDVTFLVAYFKGMQPRILYCPDYPPCA